MGKQLKIVSLLFITISVFISSCQSNHGNKQAPAIADFIWLCGNWKNDSDTSALFFEKWQITPHKNYSGISYILAKNDTVFFESIQLFIADTGTFYAVTVPSQNNAKTVNFKLVSSDNQTYIFENKKHDFPQRIAYQYKALDTLNAWIEGKVKGKFKKESFLMWRDKSIAK